MSDIDRQLAELAQLWNRVERRCKEIEQFNERVVIACINEMRYAGRRIVDALSAQRQGKPEQEIVVDLQIAKNYLINADHDLTDCAILDIHYYIRRLLQHHDQRKIIKHVPEFKDLYPEIALANSIVAKSRETRDQRITEYERLAVDYLPKLMSLIEKLKSHKKIRIGDEIKWSLRIITFLGVIGSVASIIGVSLAIWGLYLIFNPPT